MKRELKRNLLIGTGAVVPRNGCLVCLKVEELKWILQCGQKAPERCQVNLSPALNDRPPLDRLERTEQA
jgi:hypothetical protein